VLCLFDFGKPFTLIVRNNYRRICGKMGLTIEESLFIGLLLSTRSEKATNKITVHSKYNYAYDSKQDKRFDKTKDEVALLLCSLFDHLALID
jgi:hypothetical protein